MNAVSTQDSRLKEVIEARSREELRQRFNELSFNNLKVQMSSNPIRRESTDRQKLGSLATIGRQRGKQTMANCQSVRLI